MKHHKNMLLVIAIVLFASTNVFAQINYTFSATTGTFTPLTGATVPTLTGGDLDDGWFDNLPIGFTFNYNSIGYTTISAATNGCFVFGPTVGASMITNNLTTGIPRPVIAPLWDDGEINATTGVFSYKTEGSAPNRIFTAEWLNVEWNYSVVGPSISFQAKLYEATKVVEFIYRPEATPVSGASASIGITAIATGSGNFLSLDGTGTSPSASSTIETTTLSAAPATGQIYRFTLLPILIAHTALTNTYSNLPRVVSATISASVGIAGVPNQPRVYYRTGTSGPYTSITMTNTTGSTWEATIPGYPMATTVQYYIAVQDLAVSPNVITAPSGGSGVNPPGTTPPATPYQYSILVPGLNYAFSATSGTFTPLVGASTPALSGGSLDDGYYNILPIGFTFNYNGVDYTTISATTNGVAFFGGPTLTSSYASNNLTSNAIRPAIAPLWDDLEIDATGSFSYLTEGTAPNRVFTAQWLNVQWYYSGSVPVISFQVKLYEATGTIEFIYQQEPNPIYSTVSASIGISGIDVGAGNFISLDGTGSAPNASKLIEATTLNSKPATGQIYRFDIAPTINHSPLTNTNSTAPILVSADIISLRGIASAPNQPRLYYRGATSGSYSSVVMTNPSGNNWQASIPGYPGGTIVQYYIAAQDNFTPPGVGTAPLGGSGANPPGTTPPTTPYQYVITLSLSGNFIINKDGGGNFATFTDAFMVLNACGLFGPATFTVTGTTSTVTYPECNLTLGGAGSALLTTLNATNTLTFVNAVGKTINMSGLGIGPNDFCFRLMGVDYVTFDGINIVEIGTSANTYLEYGYILNNATPADGAKYNTITNFTVTLDKTNTNSVVGVCVGNGTAVLGATLGTAGTILSRNNYNKIKNFTIQNVKRGISFDGLAIPAFDEGNEVSGPAFASATGGTWVGGSRITNFGVSTAGTDWGISIDGQKDIKIFNVQIDGGSQTGATYALSGIHFGTLASTCDGADNAEIYNCVIRDLQNNVSLTSGVCGIRATATTLHKIKVYNTAIYDIRATAATGANVMVGMYFGGPGAGSKIELYNNSINITGATAAAGTAKGISFGSASVYAVSRNNAIQVTGGGATGGAILLDFGATAPTLLEFSNNIYNVGTTDAARRVAVYGSTNRINLIDWQSTMVTPSDGLDLGSGYGDPGYVSGTDLLYGVVNRVNNSGTPITGLSINTDILGITRSSIIPDIGMFEGNFSAGFVDVCAASMFIAPLEGSIAAEIPLVVRDNVETGNNLTAKLWYRLGIVGAFTGLSPDITPTGATNGTYRWGVSLRALPAGTYQYYIVTRDAVGNSFASPTMTPGAVAPGFTVSPNPPDYNIASPFASAGVRTFQNVGTTLAAGTYTVGTVTDYSTLTAVSTGKRENYPTLTAVALDISAKPLAGNVVFELTNNYNGVGETFPIVFNQPSYVSGGPWTITIRPASDVTTERVIQGNPGDGIAVIYLDGARRVTIDGRPGGTGSSRLIRVTNSRSTTNIGEAIFLMNDALNNTIKYIVAESNNPAAGLGVIGIYATYSGGQGNNNNVIDNCEIRNYAAGTAVPPNPARGLVSWGGNTPASYNKNNTFSNNLIHDFHSLTGNPIGIRVSNSSGMIITGNHIYQTTAKTGATALTQGMAIASATVNGHTITGNYIGGSEPFCGGSPYTLSSTSGIYVFDIDATGYLTTTTIQNNTIANFSLNTGPAAAAVMFAGVLMRGGNQVPIVCDNNTIGNTTVDATTNPSVTVTTTTAFTNTAMGVFAIAGLNTITNNRIGGFKMARSGAGLATSFVGIQQQTAGYPTSITGNLIGSLTTANNIYHEANVSGATSTNAKGIVSIIGGANIVGNTIANITSIAPYATIGTRGIEVSVGVANIRNNVVRNITANNVSTWTDYDASILGIELRSTSLGQLVQGNTVYNLTASNTGTAITSAQGIRITSGTGSVLQNNIYNIINNSTGTGPYIYGIHVAGGTWIVVNNMVSLGDGLGGNLIINGLRDAGTGIDKYYYNSVNISGAVTTGANKTYAFMRTTTATDTLRDNIFANFRTGGTGSHFSIGISSTTGWGTGTSNYNDLYAVTPTTVGEWVTTALTFAGWQAVQPGGSGGDLNSINVNSDFISTIDLHINGNSNSVNRKATPIVIKVDYDSETRNLTFPDIGADEYTPNAPSTFNLISPVNGATNVLLSGQLVWNKATLAQYYDVYLSVDSPPVVKVCSLQTDTSYGYTLMPNTTYYWKVVAQNDTGVIEGSVPSAVWSFQTEIWDVGATAIIKPSAIGFAGNVIIPKVKVENFGSAMVSFPVTMIIGSGYTDTTTVNNLMAGDSLIVNFDPWTAALGTYNLLAYTNLVLDNNYANDTVRSSVEIQPPAHNVGTMEIIAPMDTIVEGTVVTPRARIKNFGAYTETFTVRFKIGEVYNQVDTIHNFESGAESLLSFPNWTAVRCNYVVSCSTELEIDQLPEDDKITEMTTVKYSDVGVVAILAPQDTVITCNDYTPMVVISNNGVHTYPALCSVMVKILRYPAQMTSYCNIGPAATANVMYESWMTTELAMGEVDTIYFPEWHPYWWDIYWTSAPMRHLVIAEVKMAADMDSTNNTLQNPLIVKGRSNDLQVNWAGLLSGNNPPPAETIPITTYNVASVVSNSPLGPTAVFRAYSRIIRNRDSAVVYSKYLDRTLNPQTYACLYFQSGWVPEEAGWYLVKSWIQARPGIDMVSENNYVERLYYVRFGGANVQSNNRTTIPLVFSLLQNQPNPFKGITNISYQIPVESKVAISVYDASGRNIKTLVNENRTAGYYNTIWNCTDNNNQKVAAGVYFYEMKSSNYTERHKMVITH